MDEKQSEEEVLPNYYAVIPAEVRYHPDLTWFDKCLYGEVSALASKKGYCWAKNTYFSHVLGVGVRTLQLGLKRLVKAGFIDILFVCGKDGERQIHLRFFNFTGTGMVKFNTNLYAKNYAGGRNILRKPTQDITQAYINNKDNNKLITTDCSLQTKKEKKRSYSEESAEVMDFFNKVCQKRYLINPARVKMISQLIVSGATVDQMKQAIVTFSKDTWEDRHKYMDPVYCLGTVNKRCNFEKWFNMKNVKPESKRKML